MTSEQLISTGEAAKILEVSQMRVRQFYQTGRLPGRMVGNFIVFDRADVVRFARKPRPNGRPQKNFKKKKNNS